MKNNVFLVSAKDKNNPMRKMQFDDHVVEYQMFNQGKPALFLISQNIKCFVINKILDKHVIPKDVLGKRFFNTVYYASKFDELRKIDAQHNLFWNAYFLYHNAIIDTRKLGYYIIPVEHTLYFQTTLLFDSSSMRSYTFRFKSQDFDFSNSFMESKISKAFWETMENKHNANYVNVHRSQMRQYFDEGYKAMIESLTSKLN